MVHTRTFIVSLSKHVIKPKTSLVNGCLEHSPTKYLNTNSPRVGLIIRKGYSIFFHPRFGGHFLWGGGYFLEIFYSIGILNNKFKVPVNPPGT